MYSGVDQKQQRGSVGARLDAAEKGLAVVAGIVTKALLEADLFEPVKFHHEDWASHLVCWVATTLSDCRTCPDVAGAVLLLLWEFAAMFPPCLPRR